MFVSFFTSAFDEAQHTFNFSLLLFFILRGREKGRKNSNTNRNIMKKIAPKGDDCEFFRIPFVFSSSCQLRFFAWDDFPAVEGEQSSSWNVFDNLKFISTIKLESFKLSTLINRSIRQCPAAASSSDEKSFKFQIGRVALLYRYRLDDWMKHEIGELLPTPDPSWPHFLNFSTLTFWKRNLHTILLCSPH